MPVVILSLWCGGGGAPRSKQVWCAGGALRGDARVRVARVRRRAGQRAAARAGARRAGAARAAAARRRHRQQVRPS